MRLSTLLIGFGLLSSAVRGLGQQIMGESNSNGLAVANNWSNSSNSDLADCNLRAAIDSYQSTNCELNDVILCLQQSLKTGQKNNTAKGFIYMALAKLYLETNQRGRVSEYVNKAIIADSYFKIYWEQAFGDLEDVDALEMMQYAENPYGPFVDDGSDDLDAELEKRLPKPRNP